MPSKTIRLTRRPDGYYRTAWIGPDGVRYSRTFGNVYDVAVERFSAFQQEWLSSPSVRGYSAKTITFAEGVAEFEKDAEGHYRRKDGTDSGGLKGIRAVAACVHGRIGDMAIAAIKVADIEAARVEMIESALARSTINVYISKLGLLWKYFFHRSWASHDETERIRGLRGLSAGRMVRRADGVMLVPTETEGVGTVPDAHVRAVLDHFDANGPKTMATLIRVLDATGMRPGEALSLRTIDLDMSRDAWEYRPATHKTQRRQGRVVLIGPRGQELLRPLLKAATGERLFADIPVYAAALRMLRKACEATETPNWGLNQLRHNAATRLRTKYGIETARAVLGHANAKTTEIYAEMDMVRARQAALDVG